MKVTLSVGVLDDNIVVRLGDKEIHLDVEQVKALFNAIGEALEVLGGFAECDDCPNKESMSIVKTRRKHHACCTRGKVGGSVH